MNSSCYKNANDFHVPDTWTTRTWYALPFCIVTVNYFSILASVLWPLLLVLLFVVNPDGQMFLYSALPDWVKSHSGVYELVLVIQTVINFWGCTMEGAAFCWWSANVFQNLIWLQDLVRYWNLHKTFSLAAISALMFLVK